MYAACVYQDGTDFAVTFIDFPDISFGGRTEAEAIENARANIHFEMEEMERIPRPTELGDVLSQVTNLALKFDSPIEIVLIQVRGE